MAIESINPSTGKVLEIFDEWPAEKAAQVAAEVQEAWLRWRAMSLAQREVALRGVAEVLRREADEYAPIMALELGKPVREGRREVERCADVLDYFARNAVALLAEPGNGDATTAASTDPFGVVLAVADWQHPFWGAFRLAAPALMAGNAVILKHSSDLPFCALQIENIFRRAGFPEGVFRSAQIRTAHLQSLLQNELVRAVAISGSGSGSSEIAEEAQRLMKKTVLRPEGAPALIVLADADLEHAARGTVTAPSVACGQSCTSAARVIVDRTVYAAFLKRLEHASERLVVGDPLDEETQVGPLAREGLLQSLQAQVTDAVEKGAELILGGKRLQRDGYFYSPTILAGVRAGMRAFEEEVLGPVLSVIGVHDLNEAIAVAKVSPCAQTVSLWGGSPREADEVAAHFHGSMVYMNGIVHAEPHAPLARLTLAGYSREACSHSIHDFLDPHAGTA